MTAPASSAPPDLDAIIQRRIRQDVQSMHAYAIQDSIGMVKLDAMENPHRLPPSNCADALGERLGRGGAQPLPGRPHRRPAPRAGCACPACPTAADIMLGNGSDD
jgi:histidinol-phosphate aminotransferase